MKRADLLGKRFGKWLVIDFDTQIHKWKTKCDCGEIGYNYTSTLRSGQSKQCQKCKSVVVGNKNSTHKQSKTKLYHIYRTMLARCYNKNSYKYHCYGERGIAVCDDWKNNFENFHDWAINNGYQQHLSIDRIDNNGNYTPENCRWVDSKTQANNNRKNRKITYNGETLNLCQWQEKTGIKRETIAYRLNRGWSIERALTEKAFIGKNQTFESVVA